MNKTIKFNNCALFNLQTLNGIIRTTWGMHYDESEEKIEDAFQRGIVDFDHVKNRYDETFNMKNGPFDYDIDYEKKLLSKLNEEFKTVRSYKLPWFMKTYTDFIEEKFNELMVIYKNGGWK
ncbi:hypothetical protein DYE50_01710 [Treponema ruminis]|uniref:Uncharacterized protein n=1 Tax=Treponema ruminis TaxID=744515 RepID=A0A7W8GAN8_9SPIR|nr:hypothetical protein [Treponema ruminis]MBB5226872.1 hypothetical protein [Treponema ruminis]QSI01300.1 hypothetical protein DYE50_01710 [Treponema ruminis]